MARIPNAKTAISEFKGEVKPCELNPEEISGFTPSAQSDLNSARTNKFILVIDLPKCFSNLDKGSCRNFKLRKLQMNVFGKVVPELEVPSSEVAAYGQTMKVSSLSRGPFPPVTAQFTVDSKYENYFVLYKWLDIINSFSSGGFDTKNETAGTGKLPDYSATFTLYLLNEYDDPISRWNYAGAFPTNLGSINLNKRDPEDVDCDFTFEYSFITMELM